MKNNTLFNELSGYIPTGGVIGHMFNMVGDFIEDISGLNDKENDRMLENLEACRKYYAMKQEGLNVTNAFSRYGDIAQINNETYVECGKNLVTMRQFHVHPRPVYHQSM